MSTCKVDFKGYSIDSSSLDNYLNQFTIDGKQKIDWARERISDLILSARNDSEKLLELAYRSEKDYIRNLARMMAKSDKKITTSFVIDNNLKGFSFYSSTEDKIYINVDAIAQRYSENANEFFYDRLVHDFIRGFTDKEIKKVLSSNDNSNPYIKNIVSLFNEYKSNTSEKYRAFLDDLKNEPYIDPRSEKSLIRDYNNDRYRAIVNPYEFVSFGLTNGHFRNVLRKYNLWQKFVSWLKDLLGISQDNNDLEYLYKNLDSYLKTKEEEDIEGNKKTEQQQTGSQEEITKKQENYGEEFQVDQFIFSYNPETGKYYQHFKSKKGEVKELTNEKQQNKTFLKYIEKHPEHAEIVNYENTGNKYVYDEQRDKVISLSTVDTIVQNDIVDKVKNHKEYEKNKKIENLKKHIKSILEESKDLSFTEIFDILLKEGVVNLDDLYYFSEAFVQLEEELKENKLKSKSKSSEKTPQPPKEEKSHENKSEYEFEFSYNGITIPTKFKLSEEQEQALITLIENVTSGNKEPITLSGYAGCLAYGTKILMFDGSYKEVQDIVIGDKLMGIDSTPRTVLELKRGREQMYWIHQNKGKSYRVNESHILSTKHHKKGLVNQTVLEYLSHKTSAKDYKGYKIYIYDNFKEELTNIRIEKDIVDDYYGFTLDGDNLFILEDFTVTHNTGKTSVIRYLEDYLRKIGGYNFIYGAPTHAATVYLGYNIDTMPFTIASSVIPKRDKNTGRIDYVLSGKVRNKLNNFLSNIFIVDEASLMDTVTLERFLEATSNNNIKVIFMGDKMQLPEVASKGKINPETKNSIKDVSKAFTDFEKLELSKVQRTKDNGILRVLTEIRNNPDGVLPIIDNTETIKFHNKEGKNNDFYREFSKAYKEDPEETVYISYTNEDIKNFNKSFRNVLYGNTDDGIVKGESIIGYIGYGNKSIALGNLANSIKYTVDKVQYNGSEVIITLRSSVLKKLFEKHNNKASDITKTTYLQLSKDDSLNMKNLTEEDFKKNNENLSSIFKKIYELKKKTLENGNWTSYDKILKELTDPLAYIDLSDDYFYNPYTDRMEKESSANWDDPKIASLKSNFKEIFMKKGIDYGYGITIHKSQGATYKNVFFNASSTDFAKTEIHENGMQISTEGNSLNYVGMSRASEKLHVLHSNNIKRLSDENTIEITKNCSIF